MKSLFDAVKGGGEVSRPARGAWVEMGNACGSSDKDHVAPRKGRVG